MILDNEGPGNLDYEYNPGQGADGRVLAIALQPPNSKAVFGGQFTFVNGIGFNRIARLNFDGSVDNSFNPGLGANQDVQAISTQADGKILIGGAFTSFDNVNRGRIARLNANGSLDTAFAQGSGANGLVRAIAVQPGGRILIAGDFKIAVRSEEPYCSTQIGRHIGCSLWRRPAGCTGVAVREC